jgi:hypothetical protein
MSPTEDDSHASNYLPLQDTLCHLILFPLPGNAAVLPSHGRQNCSILIWNTARRAASGRNRQLPLRGKPLQAATRVFREARKAEGNRRKDRDQGNKPAANQPTTRFMTAAIGVAQNQPHT